MKPKVAIVRGKFLNRYEMQLFEPLTDRFRITAFGSLTPYHDRFRFPVVRLPSPMDIPDFPYKMPFLNRICIDAHYLLGLEGKLAGFDLVHTAETYFHFTQQCLRAKRLGLVKKVIATVLENIPFNNEGIWGRSAFKKAARTNLDHIIALTEKTKETLIMEGANPEKITVIHHAIDTDRFVPPGGKITRPADQSRQSITILFVGRLEEYKGVFDVVLAAKKILADRDLKDYRIMFTIVGDGSEKAALLALERRLGIEASVVHEVVSYDDMPRIYREADIFIAPSKPTRTYHEQYCTALLEAQASGMPIVTTSCGGIPENIGNAGIIVPPGDFLSLYQSVKAFILSPQMRSEYATRARRRAETVHTVPVVSAQMAKLYDEVLK